MDEVCARLYTALRVRMDNRYTVLGRVFREIALLRGHFAKQLRVLRSLAESEGLHRSSRILDAACGTGDVLLGLRSDGFEHIQGCDGSEAMLAQWPSSIDAVPRRMCDWAELDTIFDESGPFDLVFFLGHSLPHLHRRLVPKVMKSVYDGLNVGGLLAFDIRDWVEGNDGSRWQAGRETSIPRLLGDVALDGVRYQLSDRAYYCGHRQFVEYRLVSAARGGKTLTETLTYDMFVPREAVQWLLAAGFAAGRVSVRRFAEWPYLVITARR